MELQSKSPALVSAEAVKAKGIYGNMIKNLSPDFTNLFEAELDKMLHDCYQYLKKGVKKEYYIQQDKVGIIKKDGTIDMTVVHKDYKAQYRYLEGFKEKTITRERLERNIGMNIKYGTFLIKKNIKENLKTVFGISGGLQEMTDQEMAMLQKGPQDGDYKFIQQTFVPSVFSEDNVMFDPKKNVYLTENEDGHHTEIAEKIQDLLVGNEEGKSKQRAVVVFLKDEPTMKALFNSRFIDGLGKKDIIQ